ncbi:MAG: GlsB/YeaQ/YmgE family stress response membrane protein [Solirubrobacterales bacterium]
MQILGLIVIGIVIGIIARLVLPGRQHIGALMTVLLGIGGALVGGIVASAIGEGDIFELNFIGTIVGVIAAVGLIAIAEALGVGEDRARRV